MDRYDNLEAFLEALRDEIRDEYWDPYMHTPFVWALIQGLFRTLSKNEFQMLQCLLQPAEEPINAFTDYGVDVYLNTYVGCYEPLADKLFEREQLQSEMKNEKA
jgi:hypothetical protein